MRLRVVCLVAATQRNSPHMTIKTKVGDLVHICHDGSATIPARLSINAWRVKRVWLDGKISVARIGWCRKIRSWVRVKPKGGGK